MDVSNRNSGRPREDGAARNAPAVDVSVVITAHREGVLAHRSVRSALRSTAFAEESGIVCEIIVVLDKPDSDTLRYFHEHREVLSELREVEFGDLAASRNHGARLARGRYIAFLDADDLFSENWIDAAFRLAEGRASERLVLHPEISLYFGQALRLWHHISLGPNDPERFNLLADNYWTALAFASKELVQAVPYTSDHPDAGFGYEDWHWNCETLAAGATHCAVPETAHFIRIKADQSLLQEKNRAGTVLPPSALFDSVSNQADGPAMRADTRRHAARALHSVRSVAKKVARTALGDKVWARRIALVARDSAYELLGHRSKLSSPPDWLAREWHAISHVDPDVFPTNVRIDFVPTYSPRANAAVPAYERMYRAMGDAPTHVFVLPWLRRGGADLAALHYMRVVAEGAGNRVACVLTEAADSPWLDRVPSSVRVVELARWTPAAGPEARAQVLFRLLLQKQPHIIHNVNSEVCYDLFVRYGRALCQCSRLVDSAYCEEYSSDGRLEGYALKTLPHCFQHLTAVITDSRGIVERLHSMFALDPSRFVVAYNPARVTDREPQLHAPKPITHVLWAGRLDLQKRPDVLLEVALRLQSSPFVFHVYGSSGLGGSFQAYRRDLSRLPNVLWHGEFDGFASIPHQSVDVLLYTTSWDGLPNILLEAAGVGLPIVAPDSGAVAEFVSDRTGYLVSSSDAIDEYVAAIQCVRDDPAGAHRRAAAAQELLATRHSEECFRQSLSSIPGYLCLGPGAGAR